MTVKHLPEDQQRAAVIAEARSWIRTPYHHEACRKGHGVDCAYFLIGVWSAPSIGLIEPFKVPHYPPDWALHRDEEQYIGWLDRLAQPLPDGAVPKPADVVVYQVGRCFSHAAIIIDWPNVIHSSRPDRMVTVTDARLCHRLMTNRDGTMRDHRFYSYWGR